jgi:hypothetical protein
MENTMTSNGKSIQQLVLYRSPDGKVDLEVRMVKETVWLSQKQMASLFNTERSVISKHLSNIFKTKELEQKSNVQKMHIPNSDRPAAFYSLDTIISVGYRVNSKRGTQFRIWATRVLREHIIKGYTINEKRLKEQNARLIELERTVELMGSVIEKKELAGDEADGLLRVITDYARGLKLLDQYDYQKLSIESWPQSHFHER